MSGSFLNSARQTGALTHKSAAQTIPIALRESAGQAHRCGSDNRETPNNTYSTEHNRHLDPSDSRCTAADCAALRRDLQEGRAIDIDEVTGCADDQAFAAIPVDLLRRIADG